MADLEKEIAELQQKQGDIQTEVQNLNSNIRLFTLLAWICIFIGIVLVVLALFKYYNDKVMELGDLGTFIGGTTGVLCSLSGIFFIYVAFLGQKQQLLNQQLEIRLNQLEFKATRIELEGQKQQLELQNETMKKQQFENTFFQLLQNHNDILNHLDLINFREEIIKSRDCFEVIYQYMEDIVESERKKFSNSESDILIKQYEDIYIETFNTYQSDLSHYFTNLYHIFKFIDESNVNNKSFYTSLIRAQISRFELILLFYNCSMGYGQEKFKPLVERYALLKRLDASRIFNTMHLKLFKFDAYGDNADIHDYLK